MSEIFSHSLGDGRISSNELLRLTGILTVSLLCWPASRPQDPGVLVRARDNYIKAVEGDREAGRESEKLFEQLLTQKPDNPILIAYIGSLHLLESGRTLAVWRRGKLAKDGLAALDRAVSLAADDPEVRFLRAISTYHLPAFFQREQQAAADLKWVAEHVSEAVPSGRLDRRFAAAALYRYGLILERESGRQRAEEEWKRAIQIAPRSRAAADASRRLSEISKC